MKTITRILLALGFSCVLNSAFADIVVIVSQKNPTQAISQDDVDKIFLGKLKLFPDGSSAIPLDMPANSREKKAFYESAIGKDDSQLRAYWSRIIFTGSGQPPKTVTSEADMLKLVAENPNTIGYIDKSQVNGSVKVVWQAP